MPRLDYTYVHIPYAYDENDLFSSAHSVLEPDGKYVGANQNVGQLGFIFSSY